MITIENCMPYLFRTYNRNKYKKEFDIDSTIGDAVRHFEDTYNFIDVFIYPIEDKRINYNVNMSSLLSSFESRLFLLCARYTRDSIPYTYDKSQDAHEIHFMKTPTPTRFFEQATNENILLIQQYNMLIDVKPNIFNDVLEIARKTSPKHFNILDQNKDKIKDLLKQIKDESEKIQSSDSQELESSKDDKC